MITHMRIGTGLIVALAGMTAAPLARAAEPSPEGVQIGMVQGMFRDIQPAMVQALSRPLRDMIQNHLLQVMATVAMEPPATFESATVRDERAKLLRSIRIMPPAEVVENSVAGQYGRARVGGEEQVAYREEEGVGATEAISGARHERDSSVEPDLFCHGGTLSSARGAEPRIMKQISTFPLTCRNSFTIRSRERNKDSSPASPVARLPVLQTRASNPPGGTLDDKDDRRHRQRGAAVRRRKLQEGNQEEAR